MKMMKVRLQQPSGRELAPFNPISPPAAITQVLLLANPLKVGLLCLMAEFSLHLWLIEILFPSRPENVCVLP